MCYACGAAWPREPVGHTRHGWHVRSALQLHNGMDALVPKPEGRTPNLFPTGSVTRIGLCGVAAILVGLSDTPDLRCL